MKRTGQKTNCGTPCDVKGTGGGGGDGSGAAAAADGPLFSTLISCLIYDSRVLTQ